jgi:two-component system cell cycle sensor histidine kinase/response regulator CckA
VEDEDVVRQVTREILEQRGYRVIEAANGEQALRAFEFHGGLIHLVLCDVVLPGISGPEVVARLRRRGAAPRVLYVSGEADDPVVVEGVEEALLAKPFSPAALGTRVRQILDGKG